MVSQVHAYIKTDQTAHFKHMQFSVVQLYLDEVEKTHKPQVQKHPMNKRKEFCNPSSSIRSQNIYAGLSCEKST